MQLGPGDSRFFEPPEVALAPPNPEPALRARVLALLEESPGFRQLTKQSASEVQESLNEIIANLNEKALNAIIDNLKGFRVFETTNAMKRVAAAEGVPMENKERATGWYDRKDKEIWAFATGLDSTRTLAHELGHAIDGPNHTYSGQAAWIAAWKTEIQPGFPNRIAKRNMAMEKYARENFGVSADQLTPDQINKALAAVETQLFWLGDYAATSPQEGLAEFMYKYTAGSDWERRQLQEKYPLCWQFLVKEGIISDSP